MSQFLSHCIFHSRKTLADILQNKMPQRCSIPFLSSAKLQTTLPADIMTESQVITVIFYLYTQRTLPPAAARFRVIAGLLTFCEGWGLSCVRQAELALLPAAVVTDQGVVGLLNAHIVADTEHVTGGLEVQQHSWMGKAEPIRQGSSSNAPFELSADDRGTQRIIF